VLDLRDGALVVLDLGAIVEDGGWSRGSGGVVLLSW
jgi:hypothetical protein